MANESSFTGSVIFFHKRLNNTPENIKKFKKILDVFLEVTNTYYGGFQEVVTDDMEFNEKSDYVESISYYFFSCGRWTYENSFNYINKISKEGFEQELNNFKDKNLDKYIEISFYDLIGLGFQVIGADYEPGCEVLYDFDAESHIIGIKEDNETEYEVIVNSCEDIPFTAQNVNKIDEDYIYYDFNTVYGIDVFLKAMFTSYYDDIVNYHYEQMLPIPELILRIIRSNYLEYDDQLQDFLLLAKEIFGKYAHEKNFSPESIQLILITCRNDSLELYHRNFSKSLNYIMRELISEAGNYLIFK